MIQREKLVGRVVSYSPPYFVVECPDAHKTHLKIHNLVQSQMGEAKVGDLVELSYYSTPSRGFWHVSRIL